MTMEVTGKRLQRHRPLAANRTMKTMMRTNMTTKKEDMAMTMEVTGKRLQRHRPLVANRSHPLVATGLWAKKLIQWEVTDRCSVRVMIPSVAFPRLTTGSKIYLG